MQGQLFYVCYSRFGHITNDSVASTSHRLAAEMALPNFGLLFCLPIKPVSSLQPLLFVEAPIIPKQFKVKHYTKTQTTID
jgi:hypothetical protein